MSKSDKAARSYMTTRESQQTVHVQFHTAKPVKVPVAIKLNELDRRLHGYAPREGIL